MRKKLTIEFVRESFGKEGYTLLDTIYKNTKTKLNYVCPKGHKHNIIWDSWSQGQRCSYCVGNIKLSFSFVKESFEKEGYTLLSKKYINSRSKLNYVCPQGHQHSVIWASWQQGQRCPICNGHIKIDFKFVKSSFEKYNYTLLSKEYINANSKLNYICPNEHKHSIKWNHWQAGHRCPTCDGQTKPTIEFIKKSFEKENYILLDDIYTNAKTKLSYICSHGHKHSTTWSHWQSMGRCPTCAINNITGHKNYNWKGGVIKRNVPLYDTYHPQINFCEETRRNPSDLDILQVKCTKCNKWFTPTLKNVSHRIDSLNKSNKGENRFYCSNECKHSCSIFNKVKYSAEEKQSKKRINNPNFTSAELNIWSKEILKRANNTCEYCSAKAEHAHHIQPKKLEPFLALDPDNGVACCETCHYKYGHNSECSTGNLANIIC